MDCLDPLVPPNDFHSIFLRLCINLFLNLLLLFPLGLLLAFTLKCAKRVHLNTRLILAIIPLTLALEFLSKSGKLVLFQLLLHSNLLAPHQEPQGDSNPSQFVFCLSTADLNPNFDQILRWTVSGPSILSHFLLNSLPLALLAEKFCATIFYKHYEKGQRFLWLGIGILAIQLISALLLLAHTFRPSLAKMPTQKEDSSVIPFDFWAFVHLLALLLNFALLSFNNKLSRQLTGSTPHHDSTLPCTFSKGSSPRLVTCRYQIRENRRSLRFCVAFTGMMSALAFLNLLIAIFGHDNFALKIDQNGEGIRAFLAALFKSASFGQQIIGEFHNLLIFLLASLCTLFGHESLRLSLLSQLGTHCKMFAARRSAKPKPSNANKPIRLAVTNASSSSSSPPNSSSQSNSSSPDSAIPVQQNGHRANKHSRISDAHSMNEILRNAHFDALQDYWAKNGPEEAKKKKRGSTGKERTVGTGKCKFRSAPCSTAVMETAMDE